MKLLDTFRFVYVYQGILLRSFFYLLEAQFSFPKLALQNLIYAIKKNFVFAILLFCVQLSYAQLPDYHVQVLDESVGIHANVMRSLLIDKKDFLWMMYEDRVQRYDGHQNKEFVLDNNKLLSICCDEQNHIWVNSNHNIFLFINDQEGFIEVAYDTTPGIVFGQFIQMNSKPLWILTNKGFYCLNELGNRFIQTRDSSIEKLSQKNFNTKFRSVSVYGHSIFFASADSLYAYNTSEKKISSLVCHNLFSVNAISEDRAIMSTWRDTSYWYNFQQHTVKLINIAADLHLNENAFFKIGGIEKTKPGFWMAPSNLGMLEYNDTAGHFRVLKLYSNGRPLQAIRPANAYLDPKQNIWVVSDFGLISFPVFQQQIGLIRNDVNDKMNAWGNDVRNFVEDKAGNLWFAAYNGFCCWNIASGIIKSYYPVQGAKNVLSFRSIRGIAYDGKYVILGPTDLGMWLFDPVHEIYHRPFYLPDTSGATTKKQIENDFINQIYTLNNGNHLVIARDADYLLNGKNYVLQKLNLPFSNHNIVSYFGYEDSLRRIWIGTSNGLYCFNSSLHFLFKVSQQNSSNIFTSIFEWSPGKYLIGTGGGQGLYWLQLMNNNYKLKKITTAFDHNGNITIVYKDSTNKIWLGTQNGLYRFDLFTKAVETFDYTNNVQGSAYNGNAVYRYRNILFMGGLNGINYFIPEAIKQRKDSLKVSIMKIAVNNDDSSYTLTAALRLKYFQNSIEIEYVAPYYFNPHKIKYRYLLEGVNKTWVNNNDNTSCYFALVPPGKYIFHIAASVNGTDWFENNENFSFIIAAPFWQAWWFYLLCAAAAGSLLYAIYRIRINKILAVQNIRNVISKDLHDDVGSTLSSIRMVSALARKKIKEDPGKTEELLGKISDSSERIAGNMQDIIWAVNPEHDSFENMIARMQEFAAQSLEAKNIELLFSADEKIRSLKLPLTYRRDLFMIYKEAVNNLAKYSYAKHAWINLSKNHKGFSLVIKDDGNGFEENSTKPGNGLRNMRERTKKMNGKIIISSSKETGTEIMLEFST